MSGPWEKYKQDSGPWEKYAKTSVLDQAGSGINEGLAAMAGIPVDAMTWLLNQGVSGFNKVAGTDIPQIENPVGGSESLRSALDPLISDVEPQNKAQEYARRIGHEVGANAIPALGLASKAAKTGPAASALDDLATSAKNNFGRYMGAETGMSAAAGAGGQLASDVLPDVPGAELMGQMAGALTAGSAIDAAIPRPKAPDLDRLKSAESQLWDKVREGDVALTPDAFARLRAELGDFMKEGSGIDNRLHRRSASILKRLDNTESETILGLNDLRRMIREDVINPSINNMNEVSGDGRRGQQMIEFIDAFMDGLTPADLVANGDAEDAVKLLKRAREISTRVKKAERFEAEDVGAFDRADNAASTSGTGGNQINAVRQKVKAILENPKLRQGYNAEEMQAMRDIVKGTPTLNAMRLLSKMSPSTSGLGAMSAAAQGAAAASTGNLMYTIPAGIGMGAKAGAEKLTRQQIEKLAEMIRNGAPIDRSRMTDEVNAAITAVLSGSAAQSLQSSQ